MVFVIPGLDCSRSRQAVTSGGGSGGSGGGVASSDRLVTGGLPPWSGGAQLLRVWVASSALAAVFGDMSYGPPDPPWCFGSLLHRICMRLSMALLALSCEESAQNSSMHFGHRQR